jgi:hypothetical protein
MAAGAVAAAAAEAAAGGGELRNVFSETSAAA